VQILEFADFRDMLQNVSEIAVQTLILRLTKSEFQRNFKFRRMLADFEKSLNVQENKKKHSAE